MAKQIELLMREAETKHARVGSVEIKDSIIKKTFEIPAILPFCWRDYDLNPIIDSQIPTENVGGVVLPLFECKNVIAPRITLSRSKNLMGQVADQNCFEFLATIPVIYDPCMEYIWYSKTKDSFTSMLKKIRADASSTQFKGKEDYARKLDVLLKKRGREAMSALYDIANTDGINVRYVEWFASEMDKSGANFWIPPCPFITNDRFEQSRITSQKINKIAIAHAKAQNKPVFYNLNLHNNVLKSSENLKKITDELVLDETLKGVEALYLKITGSEELRSKSLENLSILLNALEVAKEEADFVIMLSNVNLALGIVCLNKGVDIISVPADLSVQVRTPGFGTQKGQIVDRETLNLIDWENIETFRKTHGVFPGGFALNDFPSEKTSEWAISRRKINLSVISEKRGQVKKAIKDKTIDIAMTKLVNSHTDHNYKPLLTNSF